MQTIRDITANYVPIYAEYRMFRGFASASPPPRLDMFTREPHEEFTLWGNEVDYFLPAEVAE